MTLSRTQAKIVLAAVLETVAASPDGAPAGPMYAALMSVCTLEEFNGLLEIAKGREVVAKIQQFKAVAS